MIGIRPDMHGTQRGPGGFASGSRMHIIQRARHRVFKQAQSVFRQLFLTYFSHIYAPLIGGGENANRAASLCNGRPQSVH